jgi:formylglycine-generating enzyme required for sulfatase activity
MLARSLLYLATLLCAFAAAPVAWSQGGPGSRIALVIGNATYPDADKPLSVIVRDARLLAEELRRNGFEVEVKENVGKEDMKRAIDAFTAKIRPGSAALFYFGGYGIQVARQNYLLPSNAQVWSEADVSREGTSIDNLLVEMNRRGARTKIVIVDASRRNPFERRFRRSSLGLATIDAPEGTLIMCSAAPGKLIDDGDGENSLFMSELTKEIRSPNRTAEEVFNRTRIGVAIASKDEQVPWVGSSLTEDFSFARSSRPSATPSIGRTEPQPSPAPSPPAQASRTLPPPPPLPSATGPGPAVAPPPPPPLPSATSPARPAAPSTPGPSAALTTGSYKPGDVFRDCPECGDMVVLRPGEFDMGSGGPSDLEFEKPVRRVSIRKSFAIGRNEVTFREWDACVAAGACPRVDDRGWGRSDRPVLNVTWSEAKAYAKWLSEKTGQRYRLPTEAEWEYAARATTTTPFWWGRDADRNRANCRDCGTGRPVQSQPVGSFAQNPFGLFDTSGNVAEWVEDCWNDSYRGAPQDGSAWTTGQCRLRVLRGGSFDNPSTYVRPGARFRYDADVRYHGNGFRVVRELQ